jgi:SagB-type dehydrogenase family enzyme
VAPAVSRLTDATDLGEVSFRPSPSGGASHPLEIYPLVRECDGLAPGLYHYQPDRHALARVEPVGPGLEKLMKWGRFDLMGFDEPPLLLLITARFGRTAWKYQSIAYRLIHTDLGCLYQTFYLVATALDLAPCALGAVNPDLFASVTGVDVYAEPLVGAFTLGRER